MAKSLLIPFLALTVAATSCTGSSSTNDGGSGAAGSAAGAAGSAAGAAGSASGGAGGEGVMCDAGSLQPPACSTDVFSPTMFCTVLLAFCCPTTPGYTTMPECMTTYDALGTSNPFKQQCQSYHLCNAANDTGSDRTLHCGHAVGMDLCHF
jgi:hypothetical protein